MKKVLCIAVNTYRESVRSKVLYAVLFFAVILVAVSALFGSVTIGDQVKVIKDFGLLSVSLFAVALVVISGSALLSKELQRKTIYNILAKAVYRWEFLLGKHLGLFITTVVMVFLLALGLCLFAFCFEGRLDPLLLLGALYVLLEILIVISAAIFFSSLVVTPMLSGLFTFALFIAGRSAEYILSMQAGLNGNAAAQTVLEIIYWMLPHLNELNIANSVVYGSGVSLEHLAFSAIYALSYAAALLLLANIVFVRREFN